MTPTRRPVPRRWQAAAPAVAVMGLAFLVYANSLRNGLVWDDHIFIENNAFVHDPANARKILSPRFFLDVQPMEDAARPVFLLTLLADRAAWGGDPRGYHLTNVMLHAADSCLVYGLGLALLPPAGALAAGLIFAAHPMSSEAVNSPSFRHDPLVALFVLGALLLHLRWRRWRSNRARLAGIAGCAALYGLGLLSKEMAATFPLLALLVEWAAPPPKGRADRRWLMGALAAYFAVAGAYALFRAPRSGYRALKPLAGDPRRKALKVEPEKEKVIDLAISAPSKPQWQPVYEHRSARLLTTSAALGQELRLLFWPQPRADRAPTVVESLLSWRPWATWLALALAGLLSWAARRRGDPLPAACLGWLLIAWLPVSNVISIYNPIADRYLYLLTPAAAWMMAWAIGRAAEASGGRWRPWTDAAAAALLIATFSWRTTARNRDWLSDETLFTKEAEAGTSNARVFYNLGVQAQARGDDASAKKWFEQALALNPESVEARTNFAAVLLRGGHRKDAIKELKQAAARKPSSYIPYLALAQALAATNEDRRALFYFHRACDLSAFQERASVYGLAAARLRLQTEMVEATEDLRKFLAAHPQDNELRTLRIKILDHIRRYDDAALEADRLAGGAATAADAAAYEALGRWEEGAGQLEDALRSYQTALGRDPKRLSARLALAAVAGLKDPNEALRQYQQAAALAPNDKKPYYQAAFVLMDAGKCEAAIPLFKKAAELDPKDAFVALNLGVCLPRVGRLSEGLDELERAKKLDATIPGLNYNLGIILNRAGRRPEAIESMRRAAQLAPGYVDAWYNLAVLLQQDGQIPGAVEAYRKTVELAPKKIEALNNLAGLDEQLGRSAEAEEIFKQALKLHPQAPGLRNNLGGLLLRQRRFSEAEREFRAAIANTDDSAANAADIRRYFLSLGLACSAQGRAADAAQAWEEALKRRSPSSTNPVEEGLLIKAYRQLGTAEASARLRQLSPGPSPLSN